MTTTLNATIITSKGEINLNLFPELAPITVSNFVNLAQKGFYNNLIFHRVIDNFMIQAGCPMGTGIGDPGYRFEDECTDELLHDKPGILSMANAGPGTNGSQFFITHVETAWLDGKHTVFGEVTSESDLEVVNSIEQNDTIIEIQVSGDAKQLLDSNSDRVQEWNQVLADSFPNLVKS
tara:strand:+ start:161 stop:694 length:534 start_codon:yes stop_codon:yes gene_type:complete